MLLFDLCLPLPEIQFNLTNINWVPSMQGWENAVLTPMFFELNRQDIMEQ